MVAALLKHALGTAQAKDECLRLARYCARLELVLTELQLLMRTNESLRGGFLGGRRPSGGHAIGCEGDEGAEGPGEAA